MAIGKRVGNRFANIGSGGNFFGDPKTFESEEARKLASQQGFQRFADALGMAAAYETGDAQRIALAQQGIQQRKIQQKNAEEEKKYKAFLEEFPELKKIDEAFGRQAVYSAYQANKNAEAAALERERDIQTLVGAGLTKEQALLKIANVDDKFIFTDNQNTPEKIIKGVNESVENFQEESGVQDVYSNLGEAFGPVDALQSGLSAVTRPLGFEIESETNQAVRARDNLNNEIRANLVDDYTGRPNVFLLEKIEGLLPTWSATSETDARERYENLKSNIDARVKSLEDGLKGNLLSDANKEKYRNDLYKTRIVQGKLEAAILGLKNNKSSLDTQNIEYGSGKFDNYYKN